MDYQETTLEALEERMENLENHITQFNSWQTVFEKTQQETLAKLEENHQEVMALLRSLFDQQVGSASTLEDISSDHTQEHTLSIIIISHPEKEFDCIEAKVVEESHGEDLKMLGKSTNLQNMLFSENNLSLDLELELVRWSGLLSGVVSELKEDQVLQANPLFDICLDIDKFNVLLTLEIERVDIFYFTGMKMEFSEWKGGTKLHAKGFCLAKLCEIDDVGNLRNVKSVSSSGPNERSGIVGSSVVGVKFSSKLYARVAFFKEDVKRIGSNIKWIKEMSDTNTHDASKMVWLDMHDKIEWDYDDKIEVYFVNNSTCEEGLLGLLNYGEEWFILTEYAPSALRNDQMIQACHVFENFSKPNKFIVVVSILETPKTGMPYYTEVNVKFREWKGGTKLRIKEFVVVVSLLLHNKKRTSLLNQLEFVIWLLINSRGCSGAKLWLCKAVFSVSSLSCDDQELFVRLLRDRPSQIGLTSQLWQMIFERGPSITGYLLVKQSHSLGKFFERNPARILLWYSIFDEDSEYRKTGAKEYLNCDSLLFKLERISNRFTSIELQLAMGVATCITTRSFISSIIVTQGLNFFIGDAIGLIGFLSKSIEAFNTKVHVNKFFIDYFDSGQVSQFYRYVSLFDLGGMDVMRKTISVNGPLWLLGVNCLIRVNCNLGHLGTNTQVIHNGDGLDLDYDEGLEDAGCSLIHGDVLRLPSAYGLLGVHVGVGNQVFKMTLVKMVFAPFDSLLPYRLGSLLVAMVNLQVLMGLSMISRVFVDGLASLELREVNHDVIHVTEGYTAYIATTLIDHLVANTRSEWVS